LTSPTLFNAALLLLLLLPRYVSPEVQLASLSAMFGLSAGEALVESYSCTC
jgi:hypothetical protein